MLILNILQPLFLILFLIGMTLKASPLSNRADQSAANTPGVRTYIGVHPEGVPQHLVLFIGARPSGCINGEHLWPGVLANARTPRLLSGDTFGVLPSGLVDS